MVKLKDYDGEIAHDVPIIDGFKEDKRKDDTSVI